MTTKIALLGFVLSVLALPAGAASLDWLVGCWESSDRSSREVWVRDGDDSLTGFSVELKDGHIAFHEILRIRLHSDGSATYTAFPYGQSETAFTAADLSGTEVTFSNPAHDYPQEIRYERDGKNLRASISALSGKNPRSFDKHTCE